MKPTKYQKAGFDKDYNKKLMEDWQKNNKGEPPPVGGMRFFPIRLKDTVKK